MASDLSLKGSLADLTDRLVQTYGECGGIHHLRHLPLPSYREIVEILKDLREILYPGYGRRQNLHMGNVAYHVGDLIDGLHDRLTTQIARALRSTTAQGRHRPGGRLRGGRTAHPRSDLLESDAGDLRAIARPTTPSAAFAGDPAAKNGLDEILFCYPGGWPRSRSSGSPTSCYKLGVPLIPRMMTEYAHAKTGIDIHPGATIGRALLHRPRDRRRHRRDHPRSAIGVKVYQGVTLGALSFRRDEVDRRARPGDQTPSDHRGRRGDLRQRHDPRRQDRDRPPLRDRLLRLDHPVGRPPHRSSPSRTPASGSEAARTARRPRRRLRLSDLRQEGEAIRMVEALGGSRHARTLPPALPEWCKPALRVRRREGDPEDVALADPTASFRTSYSSPWPFQGFAKIPKALAGSTRSCDVLFGGQSLMVFDLSFFVRDRQPDPINPQDKNEIRRPPNLAVEILSPGQTAGELSRKLRSAIRRGVRLGWLIDDRKRQVHVLCPGIKSRILRPGDTLDGGDVLPGDILPVAELFGRLHRDSDITSSANNFTPVGGPRRASLQRECARETTRQGSSPL